MNDVRDLLERVGEGFGFPDHAFDRLIRRRGRRVRNQRLASAVVAIVVSLAAIATLLRAFSSNPNTGTPTPSPSEGIGEVLPAVFVDLRTGTATALPDSVTSLPGATQFVASPSGTKLAFAARGRSGSLEIYLATIEGDGIRQVTDGSGDAGFPSWSPDGRRIVYLRSNGGGDSTLFMVDVFTGDAPQLSEPAPIWRPRFSPGGSTIMFTRASGTSGYQPLGLWSLPMGGAKASLVVANAAIGSISPDGTQIAYHRTGPAGTSSVFDGALSFIAVHGDVRNPPLEARAGMPFFGDETGGSTLPLWSPDGSRIVYGDDGGNVTVMKVATKELTSFKGNEPSWFDEHSLIVEDYGGAIDPSPAVPTFGRLTLVDVDTGGTTSVPDTVSSLPRSRDFSVSPDGASVAFLTEPQTDLEHVHVYVANLDGTGLRRVTTGSSGYAYLPRWSPDGKKIVYIGCCSDDVYVLSLESGRSVRLTHERESVWDATFSADGSSVLFTMAEGEKLSLWRVSTAGGQPTVLISNAAFGTYSPDGSTIAFRRNHPRPVFTSCPDCWWMGFGISFANADGSEPQAASDPDGVFAPLASAPGGARWSPDGSRIVYRSDWNSIGELLVLNVATGMTERIGSGVAAEWVDNDTLLVDGFERS